MEKKYASKMFFIGFAIIPVILSILSLVLLDIEPKYIQYEGKINSIRVKEMPRSPAQYVSVKIEKEWLAVEKTGKDFKETYRYFKSKLENNGIAKFLIIDNALYSPFDITSPHFKPFIADFGENQNNEPRKLMYSVFNILGWPIVFGIYIVILMLFVVSPTRFLLGKVIKKYKAKGFRLAIYDYLCLFEYVIFGLFITTWLLFFASLPLGAILQQF